MNLRVNWLVALAALSFAIVLAVIVGQRLSTEALAVLLGVLAGVLASVPASLMAVWLATRSPRRESVRTPTVAAPQPTPTVPTPHSAHMALPPHAYAPPPPESHLPSEFAELDYGPDLLAGRTPVLTASAPRQFTVIGGESE